MNLSNLYRMFLYMFCLLLAIASLNYFIVFITESNVKNNEVEIFAQSEIVNIDTTITYNKSKKN